MKFPVRYIYKITNKLNNKVYIGTHKAYSKGELNSYYGRGTAIKEAIEDYGKSNFEKEILEYCSLESNEYLTIESKYILKLKSYIPYGYNVLLDMEYDINNPLQKRIFEERRIQIIKRRIKLKQDKKSLKKHRIKKKKLSPKPLSEKDKILQEVISKFNPSEISVDCFIEKMKPLYPNLFK
jgi:group I intron endonuclease